MSFKNQIVKSSAPEQLLLITLNHLESIKRLINAGPTEDMIQNVINLTVGTYCGFTAGDWTRQRNTLLAFVKDRKVKVSIFLANGDQEKAGNLTIRPSGILPLGVEMPGFIYRITARSRIEVATFPVPPLGLIARESDSSMDINSDIGCNIFVPCDNKIPFESAHLSASVMREKNATHLPVMSAGASDALPSNRSSAKEEISLLADLLGTRSAEAGDAKALKLNLFPSNDFMRGKDRAEGKDGHSDGEGDKYDGDDGDIIHIDIDGRSDAKTIDVYMEELGLGSKAEPSRPLQAKGGDDADMDEMDLLALMDEGCK
jgi:hypothetical protein